MVCWRPATPGFLVTLASAILLALVVFSVPFIKTIYFLEATFNENNVQGSIQLGTLGYCLTTSGTTVCSKPSVGYQFDPNQLLGNNLPIQIPEVAVKWVTYALVLNVVALCLAALAALFGLLAHVRETSMSCLSSCTSGLGAAIALIAFIFDLVLFFLAKSRINSVAGGKATIGSAVWITLVAWILLFFSGIFYSIGRCCISKRPSMEGYSRKKSKKRKGNRDDEEEYPALARDKYGGGGSADNSYSENLRLDAIKAEADRKARIAAKSNRAEGGLPAFQEYEPVRQEEQHPWMEEEDAYAHGPRRQPSSATVPAVVPVRQNTQTTQHSNGTAYATAPANYPGGPPAGHSYDSRGALVTNPTGSGPPGFGAPARNPTMPGTGQSFAVGAVFGAAGNSVSPPRGPTPGVGGSYPVGAVFGAPGSGPERVLSPDNNQRTQGNRYDDGWGQAPSAEQQTSLPPPPVRAPTMPQPRPGEIYDPYSRSSPPSGPSHNMLAAPGGTPGGLSMYSSGPPTGATYFTARDRTPMQGATPDGGAALYNNDGRQTPGYFPHDVNRTTSPQDYRPAGSSASSALSTPTAQVPGAWNGSNQQQQQLHGAPTRAQTQYGQSSGPAYGSGSGYGDDHDLHRARTAPSEHRQQSGSSAGHSEAPPPMYDPYNPTSFSSGASRRLSNGGPPRGDAKR